MKQLMWVLLGLFHLVLTSSVSTAQDLSHLIPAAHYTLINTSDDSLSLQLPINLLNSPFSGDQGVYCNGNYLYGDPDSSLVETPLISALYDSVFAVRVEFNCIGLGDKIRPVFVCGNHYRYLGFITYTDSSFRVMYNNGYNYPVPGIHAIENNWYEITLIHHTSSSLTECYLDGEKVLEFNETLDRDQIDSKISNTNFGSGRTFKGYLRNLRVYGSGDISSIQDFSSANEHLVLFPNPSRSSLQFLSSIPHATHWSVTGIEGFVIMKGKVDEANYEIDIHTLMPGGYVFLLQSSSGKILARKTFVKS